MAGPAGSGSGSARRRSSRSLAYSPDGKTLAAAEWDDVVTLRDPETGDVRKYARRAQGTDQRGRLHAQRPANAPRSRPGSTAPPGSGTSRPAGRSAPFAGHADRLLDLSISPDGKTLATASADKTVRLWDLATGTLRATLEVHASAVEVLKFSPDGKTLVSGGRTTR